jgi:hypothetical protein
LGLCVCHERLVDVPNVQGLLSVFCVYGKN